MAVGLPDPEPYVGKGPLAGLLAGLTSCRHPWLALLPIDCPFFPPEAYHQALRDCQEQTQMIGFRESLSQREQWLPGLYRKDLAERVERALSDEELSLGKFCRSVPHEFVDTELRGLPPEAFVNLNTPDEATEWSFTVDRRE